MRYDDLSPLELSVLKRLLAEALRIWDWESPTLYGLSKEEVASVERDWPASLHDEEFRAALAVNNVCADLLGGSNALSADLFSEMFGMNRNHVDALFERLRPRLALAIDAHEERA